MKIFVTGLTSTALGGMEYRNLGNYIIVEPFFQELRNSFPEAEITTSLQLSDSFCQKFRLNKRRETRFWRYNSATALNTLTDIFLVTLWKVTGIKKFTGSSLLSETSSADLVLDFSGDIYGDNAGWNKFLEENARLFLALAMKKPIAMVIGSPGPFQSFWRQWIAKRILPRVKLITNREPVSTSMLAYIGIKGEKIQSTVCPSILFQKAPVEKLPANHDRKTLFDEGAAPTVGLILCGWNMPTGPYSKWPREDWEFETFIALIRHIKETTDYRICLMAHQNTTDNNLNLHKGIDHKILTKLTEQLGEDFDNDKVFTLDGVYDAAMSKTLISTFDLVISGRIHGAVQALSQTIPTMILDYGHEPKPHKLMGFSLMYGIYDYFVNPMDADAMKRGFDALRTNKKAIRESLEKRIPALEQKAKNQFKVLADKFTYPPNNSKHHSECS